jgi:tRNA G46 methylase TrmB
MNDFLKRIQNFDLLQSLYQRDTLTTNQIIDNLGLQRQLTESEIEFYTGFHSIQNEISTGIYNPAEALKKLNPYQKFIYGEITQKGVESLNKFITSKVEDLENLNFYDIGSGNGRLILHMSLISNFKKFIGIELDRIRYLYSLSLKEQINTQENVTFINSDAKYLDLLDADVVFMNDVLFENQDIESIISKLKHGSHLISIEPNSLAAIDEVTLDVSWQEIDLPFKYYKIK